MKFDRPEDLAFDADKRRRRRLGITAPRVAAALGDKLQRAGELLESTGWVGPGHEPWCLAATGLRCRFDDEGLVKYSIAGALEAQGVREQGLELMERALAPHQHELYAFAERCAQSPAEDEVWLQEMGQVWSQSRHREFWRLQLLADDEETELMPWLQESGRVLRDVLRLVDLARRSAA